MKKLLTILFIICSIASYGQGGWIRQNTTYGIRDYRRAFDSTLLFPAWWGGAPVDGNKAALRAYDLRLPGLIGDTANKVAYIYWPKDSSYQPIGTGVGGLIPELTTEWSVNDSIPDPSTYTGAIAAGDIFLVAEGATGAFAGEDNHIAIFDDPGWDFDTAQIGDLLNNANVEGYCSNNYIYKYTESETWLRQTRPLAHIGGDPQMVKLGSTTPHHFSLITNGAPRLNIDQNGEMKFIKMTGADTGFALFRPDGRLIRADLDSLLGTVSGGGAQGFQDALDVDPDVTVDNTVAGASGVSFTWDIDRQTFNANDSIRMSAANDIGINSLSTVRILASTITAKAATATFGSNVKSIFHYQTGVGDSIAIEAKPEGMRFVGTPSGNTGSFLRRNSDGYVGTSTTVDAATELTGIVPVQNGGTGVSSVTAYGLLFGGTTTTNPFQSLTNGTSGYYLRSAGASSLPTWADASNLSPWTRGVLPSGSATTNIVYPTTQTDSVFIGPSSSGLTSNKPKALFEVNGTVDIEGIFTTQTTANFGGSGAQISGGRMGLNFTTASSPYSINVGAHSSTAGVFIPGNISSGTPTGLYLQPNFIHTSTSGTGYTGIYGQYNQSSGSTYTSGFWRGTNFEFGIQSTSATEIPEVTGHMVSLFNYSSGSQNVTNHNGFWHKGITTVSGTEKIITTGLYQFRADSIWNGRFESGAVSFQYVAYDNVAHTMRNKFESNTLFGQGTQDASAAVEIISTTQGLLLPRMTKTERDAIGSPAAGLAIYQTDNTPGLRVYNGTNWIKYSESTD